MSDRPCPSVGRSYSSLPMGDELASALVALALRRADASILSLLLPSAPPSSAATTAAWTFSKAGAWV